MQLDLDDPKVWDKWRAAYETMSSKDHRDFYKQALTKYPDQKHFNYSNVSWYFESCDESVSVIEFGGFDGSLANKCLSTFSDKIDKWGNIDCVYAKQVCENDKYTIAIPNAFNWWNSGFFMDANLLVSTHFIEHLSDTHLEELLYRPLPVDIIFESPLTEDGQDWSGDISTHKLNMGWVGIKNILAKKGYKSKKLNDQAYWFSTEGINE